MRVTQVIWYSGTLRSETSFSVCLRFLLLGSISYEQVSCHRWRYRSGRPSLQHCWTSYRGGERAEVSLGLLSEDVFHVHTCVCMYMHVSLDSYNGDLRENTLLKIFYSIELFLAMVEISIVERVHGFPRGNS